jgi:hypothetical protein
MKGNVFVHQGLGITINISYRHTPSKLLLPRKGDYRSNLKLRYSKGY